MPASTSPSSSPSSSPSRSPSASPSHSPSASPSASPSSSPSASDYITTYYVSSGKTIQEAAAAIETKLETLDSTTQAFVLIKIVHTKDNLYRAVILHKDTT